MKGVTIEGVEYLSASSLAKQFRYTTDYIGQLCRARKVDAKLVGRTWYVNPISLTKHKTARYKKVLPAEKTSEIASEITLSRTEVSPQNFVTKHQKPNPSQQPHFARRIDWKPLKYETDEVELLPSMAKPKEISHEIKLNLAEATSISVKNVSKGTRLVADELPTVSLKGKLQIESLNETFSESDNNVSSVPEMIFMEIDNKPKNIASSPKIINQTPPSGPRRHHTHVVSRVSLIPTDQSRREAAVTLVSDAGNRSGRTVEVLLLASTTVLVSCLFLLLFGELNLVAQPGFYEWEFVFSTQSLPALVSLFSQ